MAVKEDEIALAKALVSFLGRSTWRSSATRPPQLDTETFEVMLRRNLRNLLLADRSEVARDQLIAQLIPLFRPSSAGYTGAVARIRPGVLATRTDGSRRLPGLRTGVKKALRATETDRIGGLSRTELADRISRALEATLRSVGYVWLPELDQRRHRVRVVLMFLGPALITLDLAVVLTPAFRIIHPATAMFASLGYLTLIVTFVVQGRTSRRAG